MTTNRSQQVAPAERTPDSAWFKSSYSSQENGNCVEVADLSTACGQVRVRDSKDSQSPALAVPVASWTAFITMVQAGEVNHGFVD